MHRLGPLVRALAEIARRRKHWISMPELWDNTETSPWRQFRSLMRHLFERYPAPDFLAYHWMTRRPIEWGHYLYLHMAEGFSVRRFMPRSEIPISPQAAKFIRDVPPHLGPYSGLRWAQIRGMGGSIELANCIADHTILRDESTDEPFWESVLRFVIRNALLSLVEVMEIIHFLNEQKFEPGEDVWGLGGGPLPLQPDLTLKGRTLRSLRRHMANWRDDVLRKRPELAKKTFDWPRTEIAPLVHQDGDAKWLIFELLSDRALKLEGVAMNHCVETYVGECLGRKSSIWSVRIQRSGTPKRMVTVEVDPRTKQILQAQGKCNSTPTAESKLVIQRWAEQEGLTMSTTD
ncbi:PcfJ domain-containing protein [Blastopirellula marina]|uniref:PcfJ domain-containing protein n=1 Tax=Blastopirellula marina TaxID=124 RepID=UPI0013049DB3|nr:PcfJ domain-containing protein [Blastopirellula marina]